ncbi:small ribosomal subunit protein mS35-like [Physella acuta]|uniref:small ribosomal subunit protein mS35-like n=1 Tax=Physella acuta TaxID=109671 RepID=UPI0027DC898A|nr:small ribosomal subunit protein mS35-like [Physella acuta]
MAALRKTSDIQRFLVISWANIPNRKISTTLRCNQDEAKQETSVNAPEENFRVYEIEGLHKKVVERRFKRTPKTTYPPRFRSMPVDQDWTNIWPAPATFKWGTVPFPVRQGFIKSSSENDGVVPSKYGNLELMKIPNFLHLTPAHIKKQCAALKKFCTPWPKGLETDGKCRYHFPLETVTCDYVFSAPSVKDDRARHVILKFYLSDLKLDEHARDKFIRLVGHRYNRETDEVVFQTNRCPLKSQNLEFLKYVFTAVYFESWKYESWEKLKTLEDMEKYFWDIYPSRKNCYALLQAIKTADDSSETKDGALSYLPSDMKDEEAVCSLPQVQQLKSATESLLNEGENIDSLNSYKEAVKNLLNIKCSFPV